MTELNKEQSIHSPEQIRPVQEAEKAVEHQEKLEKPAQKTEGEVPAFKKHSHLKRAPIVLPKSRDELALKVEKILEENVGDAYSRLSPIAKMEFKLKGEVVAEKISKLMKESHVKVKKIFKLILEWLRMLPGINRFFLEQEAKIKTDRIIGLRKK